MHCRSAALTFIRQCRKTILGDLDLPKRDLYDLLPESWYEDIWCTRRERAAFKGDRTTKLTPEEKKGPKPWDVPLKLIRDARAAKK